MSTAPLTTAAPAAAAAPRSRGRLAPDTWRVMRRELRPLMREPVMMVMALVQPLVFLAMFAPLLPDGVAGASPLQWFVPGIVTMAGLMGASMTGSNLTEEIMSGSHERLLVSPISRTALIVGRAVKELVPMTVQTAIIVAVCAPFAFTVHPSGILVGMAILAPFCVGVGALSYALALASEGQEWLFWTVQQTLLFPVLLLAGVLLPLDGAPGWLQALSKVNPLRPIVGAERALFAGDFPAQDLAWAAFASLAVLAVGLAVGLRAMHRAGR